MSPSDPTRGRTLAKGARYGWPFRLLWRATWAPVAVVAAHCVAVLGFDAYERFPALDVPMHLIGGMAVAHFWRQLLPVIVEPALERPELRHVERVLVFGLVAVSAIGWELLELASDRLLGSALLRGLEDTLADLALGLIGGSLYLLAGRVPRVNEQKP